MGKKLVVYGTTLTKTESCSATPFFNGYLFSNSGAMAENSWVKHDGKSYYALSSGKADTTKMGKNRWIMVLF